MQSLVRPSRLAAAAARHTPLRPSFAFTLRSPARAYATESYGGAEQSGHQKSDAPNPKEGDEHPGPEAPADKGTNTSSSSSSDSGSSSTPSNNAKPKINPPKTAPEDQSAETKAHNEDMRKRPDQSVNQIDDSGKVDKEYWKGDVGPDKGDK